MYVSRISLLQLVGSELKTFWKFCLILYFNIMVAGQCILQKATALFNISEKDAVHVKRFFIYIPVLPVLSMLT
jgi:hypothetical protein